MRYIVFAGKRYYPDGGAEDIKAVCFGLPSAIAWLQESPDYALDEYGNPSNSTTWAYVYDLQEGRIVHGKSPQDVYKTFSKAEYLVTYGEFRYLATYKEITPEIQSIVDRGLVRYG